MNRHKEALSIINGAVNPIAIIDILHEAVHQMNPAYMTEIRKDPAMRLIVHQLAHLFDAMVFNDDDFGSCLRTCRMSAEVTEPLTNLQEELESHNPCQSRS